MTSRVRLLAGGALMAMVACSERPAQPLEPANTPGVREIVLSDFQFSSPSTVVPVGTTIRFRSTTSTFHTVTPDGHAAWMEIQANAPGLTFDVMLTAPGTYTFYCSPHRALGMTGSITVTG